MCTHYDTAALVFIVIFFVPFRLRSASTHAHARLPVLPKYQYVYLVLCHKQPYFYPPLLSHSIYSLFHLSRHFQDRTIPGTATSNRWECYCGLYHTYQVRTYEYNITVSTHKTIVFKTPRKLFQSRCVARGACREFELFVK